MFRLSLFSSLPSIKESSPLQIPVHLRLNLFSYGIFSGCWMLALGFYATCPSVVDSFFIGNGNEGRGNRGQKERRVERRRRNLIATGIELRTRGAESRKLGAETPVRRMFSKRESMRSKVRALNTRSIEAKRPLSPGEGERGNRPIPVVARLTGRRNRRQSIRETRFIRAMTGSERRGVLGTIHLRGNSATGIRLMLHCITN